MDEHTANLTPSAGSAKTRLSALRHWLDGQGYDGFLVPHSDEYQSEFLPPSGERLAWLTEFTGSAGSAIVLSDCAAVFVDGRYTLQASMQVDSGLFDLCHLADRSPDAWLSDTAKSGTRIAYDPRLFTKSQIARYEAVAERREFDLVAVTENPIDLLWLDQPAIPNSPIVAQPLEFSGVASADKRADIAKVLAENNDDALVVTTGDSIAWLCNIRGDDVGYTPLALCYAVLHADGTAQIFAARDRFVEDAVAAMGDGIEIANPDTLANCLALLGKRGAKVRLCPNAAAVWFFDLLRGAGAKINEAPDPCVLAKAVKNDVELAGTRAAHVRDGVALSKFLAWLDRQAPGSVDELGAAAQLEALRRKGNLFQQLSFATIGGAGPNGAIVHYRSTDASNRKLEAGLFLVDSGGQYLDGTTDVTRTVGIGALTDDMRRHFTLVLKGHIGISTARFPVGTRGSQLDALARHALWQAGLDYDHGTGHGVGSYLGVHEGPQRISKMGGDAPLQPGMIVSNEPGYYKEGAYGIRIENLVEVISVERRVDSDRDFLGFSDLTRAPIDRRLIDTSLLGPEEITWVDQYHARVLADVGPLLEGNDRSWLEAATAPL